MVVVEVIFTDGREASYYTVKEKIDEALENASKGGIIETWTYREL